MTPLFTLNEKALRFAELLRNSFVVVHVVFLSFTVKEVLPLVALSHSCLCLLGLMNSTGVLGQAHLLLKQSVSPSRGLDCSAQM